MSFVRPALPANHFGPGLTAGLIAVFFWGTQLPIAKMAMGPEGFDGWFITLLRYGMAALPLGLFWWWRVRPQEAHRAAPGETMPLLGFGVVGMTLSPLFVFIGLGLTLPEQAAIIIALQPTMTMLGKWVLEGKRPPNFTLACIGFAFIGVVCVVTKLQPPSLLTADHLLGATLVLIGAACWVVYTIGNERFHHWPGIKLTVWPMLAGTAVTCVVVATAALLGISRVPSVGAFAAFWPHVAYLGLLGVLLSMLLWTRSIKRIGALNAMLLLNLIPVWAFGVRFAQGARFSKAELLGAALVIGALIANNLYARRRHHALPDSTAEEARLAPVFRHDAVKKAA